MNRCLQKKRIDWNKSKGNNLIFFTVGLNLCYVAMILLFCTVVYETNDDAGMANLAYGALGTYNEHLVFVNSTIGLLLKGLLTVFPQVPWYPVVMYIGLFLSYCVLSYVLMKKDFTTGLFLTTIILVFFGYHTYATPQFTEVAAVLTVASIVLMIDYVEGEQSNIFTLSLIFILLVLGAGYRILSFCATFAVMSCYCLHYAWKLFAKKDNRRVKKAVLLVGLALLVCFGLEAWNRYDYAHNPLYAEYSVFNTKRSQLTDYGYPDYETNVDTYEKLHITENDLYYFYSWNIGDTEIYTKPMMDVLIERKEERHISFDFIREFFTWFPLKLLEYPWMPGLVIVICICLLINRRNYKWVLWQFALLTVLNFYLFYKGRYLIPRFDIGIFLAATVALCLFMLDAEKSSLVICTPKIGHSLIEIPQ